MEHISRQIIEAANLNQIHLVFRYRMIKETNWSHQGWDLDSAYRSKLDAERVTTNLNFQCLIECIDNNAVQSTNLIIKERGKDSPIYHYFQSFINDFSKAIKGDLSLEAKLNLIGRYKRTMSTIFGCSFEGEGHQSCNVAKVVSIQIN